MIENYYKILGVTEDATFQEIKQAYRLKAKELHPDVNKSPNAHEEFISLTEAYEYLINLKTGKVYSKINLKTKRYNTYQRWQDNEAERARRRAEYYADMKYDEFANSNYYKTITSVNVILGHLGFFLAVSILIVLPITLTIVDGMRGLITSVIVMFFTLPVTVDAIKIAPTINLKEFALAIYITGKTRIFFISIMTLLNIIAILKIGFQTLIPISELLFIFLGLILLSFVVLKYLIRLEKYQVNLSAFCLTPFALNLLLAANFLFSTNPVQETYHFTNEMMRSMYSRFGNPTREWVESTTIQLDNNKYSEFYGIRAFGDLDEMKIERHSGTYKFKDSITYTFKSGLLGLRVMTDYHFD